MILSPIKDGWKEYKNGYMLKYIKYGGCKDAWNLKDIDLTFDFNRKIEWDNHLEKM